MTFAAILGVAAVCFGAASEPSRCVSLGGAEVEISDHVWAVPSDGLPEDLEIFPSNNNVSIEWYRGRLYMAWRTAPTHFASPRTRLCVVSSGDRGETWDTEKVVELGTDIREPHLLNFRGTLFLTYFEGGTNPIAFEPVQMWRSERDAQGNWSEPEVWGEPEEVPWEFRVHDSRVWMTSYIGNHYGLGMSDLSLRFQVSDDARHWSPASGEDPEVYRGGVSEAAFTFDEAGDLWAVTRNEDGDRTGFGSLVATASAEDLGDWDFPAVSDPWRYDSPRMFCRGEEIFLVARRDPCGPYDLGMDWLPISIRRAIYLPAYSARPKRTALYQVNRDTREVVHLADLPSAADTAFPSIVRVSEDEYVVANYTSPLWFENRSWIAGQASPRGTRIYLLWIRFSP